ncbi:hypothetical protein ElyMa_005486400 [Elysia marginata]|uniref:Uncharacterized protein n=1 Tax=Elysia marginata TaxID=1093978 RepID=A0AAV4ESM6_9GAST|nr:hypothetical protein ElyMa_005486400 [Elysia marginata]
MAHPVGQANGGDVGGSGRVRSPNTNVGRNSPTTVNSLSVHAGESESEGFLQYTLTPRLAIDQHTVDVVAEKYQHYMDIVGLLEGRDQSKIYESVNRFADTYLDKESQDIRETYNQYCDFIEQIVALSKEKTIQFCANICFLAAILIARNPELNEKKSILVCRVIRDAALRYFIDEFNRLISAKNTGSDFSFIGVDGNRYSIEVSKNYEEYCQNNCIENLDDCLLLFVQLELEDDNVFDYESMSDIVCDCFNHECSEKVTTCLLGQYEAWVAGRLHSITERWIEANEPVTREQDIRLRYETQERYQEYLTDQGFSDKTCQIMFSAKIRLQGIVTERVAEEVEQYGCISSMTDLLKAIKDKMKPFLDDSLQEYEAFVQQH